jgi:signal transduction histidine kinase
VLLGRALWPGVALGAFVVNVWVGATVPVALGIAAGNTLEAVLGAWCLSRVSGFTPALGRLKDVMALVALPACLTTAVGATIGATSLELGGVIEERRFSDVWQAWWVGDMLGDLLVAPLLMTWAAPRPALVPARRSEAVVLTAVLLGFAFFVFGPWLPTRFDWLKRVNFLIPVLMWAAIRFGPRGATSTAFACAAIALWGTVSGYGPFVEFGSLREAIVGLQLYLPLIAATFLALGAVTAERAELLRREQAARVEAERAVAARDEFLAVAAHELATPLTPLQLELETLQRSLDDKNLAPSVQRRLDRASRQTKRLATLTERLLDVSRLANGKLRLEPTEFDFNAMVEGVVEEHRHEAARAGSELTFSTPGSAIGTWDRHRAEQLVESLLSNAVKYGAGRPISLELSHSGADVVLTLRDQGGGIEPAALSRVFERFERASPERRRGGLGLGLYVAREIVTAHGGTIRAESKEGFGTTFIVSLPRNPPGGASPPSTSKGAARP